MVNKREKYENADNSDLGINCIMNAQEVGSLISDVGSRRATFVAIQLIQDPQPSSYG